MYFLDLLFREQRRCEIFHCCRLEMDKVMGYDLLTKLDTFPVDELFCFLTMAVLEYHHARLLESSNVKMIDQQTHV